MSNTYYYGGGDYYYVDGSYEYQTYFPNYGFSTSLGIDAEISTSNRRPYTRVELSGTRTPLPDSSIPSSTDVKVSSNTTFSDSTILIIVALFAVIGIIVLVTICCIKARRRRRLQQPGIKIEWTDCRLPAVPPRKDIKMIEEGKVEKRTLPPIPAPLPGVLILTDEKIRQTE
ncbi:hypothetical protein SNE40_017069 [Patella caerulea]|uniref:Uncharacterized protein n=1 Tax=Patella caerulea TaxID=87958 RepID=A0AAN8J9R2_PATCE